VLDAGAVGEETARDCGSDGKGAEESCEDDVAGRGGESLRLLVGGEGLVGGVMRTYTRPSDQTQHDEPRAQLRKVHIDTMRRKRSRGRQEVHQTNAHPEGAPHGIDDRDQRISCIEPKQPCDELRQSAEDCDEGEEDGG